MPKNCPMDVAFSPKGSARILYCGKWSCDICAKVNAKEWADRAYYGITHPLYVGHKPRFWTFTLPPSCTTPKQGYQMLPRLWDTLRKEIQRSQKKFVYLAFVEGQPKRSNMPHFHVLVYAKVPPQYNLRKNPDENIKDFAAHCGFGWSAKDIPVNGYSAAWYVSHYASKGCPDIPKGFRRVRCCQAWPKVPKKKSDPFFVRAKNEKIDAYLLRVADGTGVAIDDLVNDYMQATHWLGIERTRE